MMQNTPKISCIMTTFNSEEYLRESIYSILNQSFGDFEFIISDGGSSDRTLEILRDFSKQDQRIVLLENKKRKGIAECLNDCMKIARGEVVVFMESDDISYQDRFKFEYDEIKKYSCNLVMTAWEAGVDPKHCLRTIIYNGSDFFDQYYCFCNPPLIACGMLKRELFDKIGGFGSYTWDIKFFFDLSFGDVGANIHYLDKILYFKRTNPEGASWNGRKFFTSVKENRCYAVKKYDLSKLYYIKIFYDYFLFIILSNLIFLTKKIRIYSFISPIWRKMLNFRFFKKK